MTGISEKVIKRLNGSKNPDTILDLIDDEIKKSGINFSVWDRSKMFDEVMKEVHCVQVW